MTQQESEPEIMDKCDEITTSQNLFEVRSTQNKDNSPSMEDPPLKQRESSLMVNMMAPATEMVVEDAVRVSQEPEIEIPEDLCLLPDINEAQGLTKSSKNELSSGDFGENCYPDFSSIENDRSKHTIDGLMKSDTSSKKGRQG